MATTVERPTRTATALSDRRVVLHGVSWETYEALVADHADRRSPRMSYDRGELEIVAPSEEHVRDKWGLETIVEVVVEEMGIEFDNLGMTTFRRADLQRGFEADTAFYLQHAPHVRDRRRIDLTVDPPPDLVIEVDVTHGSLDKLPIYAAIGVPEVWRWNAAQITIHRLRAGTYESVAASGVLPLLSRDQLDHFIKERGSLTRLAWLRRVRDWARQQAPVDRPMSSP